VREAEPKPWCPLLILLLQLMDFIGTIEAALGQTAKKNFLPMQDGDVQATYADVDVDDLIRDTGFKSATTLEYGIGKWVEWYRGYKQLG
jgi:UDP-glucuronate 4-epimerase